MTSTGAPSGATASRLRIGWPLAALWCTAAFLISGAIGMAFWYAPIDPVQGPIQKIFYLHLGAAISTLMRPAAAVENITARWAMPRRRVSHSSSSV